MLSPIRPSRGHEDSLTETILILLRRHVFDRLLAAARLPKTTLENASDIPLIKAIEAGQVRYTGRAFVGQFSSKISQALKAVGAKFKKDRWVLPESKLSPDVQRALGVAARKDSAVRQALDRALSEISPEDVAAALDAQDNLRQTADDTDDQFARSVRRLTVRPKLTARERARVSDEYLTNLKLSIKDWLAKDILELRKKVKRHAFTGTRYESLAGLIQKEYTVAKRKAKFLARQETNLLVSSLRDARYAEAGIDEYRWVSVKGTPEHPVRPLHQKLNDESAAGKIFRFSDPPISGTKGERQNPGVPFGCRCSARPVIRLIK